MLEIDAAPGHIEGRKSTVSLQVKPVEKGQLLQDGPVGDGVIPGVELPQGPEGLESPEVRHSSARDIQFPDGKGLLEGNLPVPVGVGRRDGRRLEGRIGKAHERLVLSRAATLYDSDGGALEDALCIRNDNTPLPLRCNGIPFHRDTQLPAAVGGAYPRVGADDNAPVRKVRVHPQRETGRLPVPDGRRSAVHRKVIRVEREAEGRLPRPVRQDRTGASGGAFGRHGDYPRAVTAQLDAHPGPLAFPAHDLQDVGPAGEHTERECDVPAGIHKGVHPGAQREPERHLFGSQMLITRILFSAGEDRQDKDRSQHAGHCFPIITNTLHTHFSTKSFRSIRELSRTYRMTFNTLRKYSDF